jgi:hypothetical protein
MSRQRKIFFIVWCCFFSVFISPAHAAIRVSFPFTPISAASLPWWIAKEARYYEKHGLDVDLIYVGASPVIIQAMLGGQAGVGAGGGPPLVTNVLQGGDIVQVATTVPYAIQSLIVEPEIRTPVDLAGKRIGISRPTRCDSSLHAAGNRKNAQRPGRQHRADRHDDPGDHQPLAGSGRRYRHVGAVHLSADERRIPRSWWVRKKSKRPKSNF